METSACVHRRTVPVILGDLPQIVRTDDVVRLYREPLIRSQLLCRLR